MWIRRSRAGALMAFALVVAACSEDNRSAGGLAGPEVSNAALQQVVYTQVEQLGKPLVSEVTILKERHDLYDRTMPYNTEEFRPETEAFIVEVGARPPEFAAAVAAALYPDVLNVDTSKDPATAGYLSNALAGGFGGRKLTDDVVDISLTAVFSYLLGLEGHSCAPFELPLCTDNVGANDKPFTSTFPYLAPPTP